MDFFLYSLMYIYFHLQKPAVISAALLQSSFWQQQCLPLHKYPSLYRMHNAPESWLLLRTTFGHAHPPAEGARQPVSDLTGHRLRLQVAELILSVQQTPAGQKESAHSFVDDQ